MLRSSVPASTFGWFVLATSAAFGQAPALPHWPAEQRIMSDPIGEIAIGDVDGDGVLDVAATLPKRLATIVRSDGFGGLQLQQDSAHVVNVAFPSGVTLADIDDDGDLDRVTALHGFNHFTAGTFWVEKNDGAGAFTVHAAYGTGVQPQHVRIADLNGDGIPDSANGNLVSLTIDVRLGIGGGAFGPVTSLATSDQTGDQEFGDLDADGDLDLVSSGWTNDRVNVRLGDGAGGFGPVTSFAMGDGPFALVLEDLDDDGMLDVAVSNSNTSTISVRRGSSGGLFGAQAVYPSSAFPRALEAGDLDGDDLPDLVAGGEADLAIHRSAGGAAFLPVTFTAYGDSARRVAVADMDGDLRQDVVVAHRAIGVMRGDGAGSFLDRAQTVVVGPSMDAAFGDVDGDGFTDVIGVHANEFSVRRCDGAGGFAAPQTTPLPAADVSRPKLFDIDGDLDLDAIVMRGFGVHVLKNDGFGTFTHVAQPATDAGTSPNDFTCADVDADGDLDLVFAINTGVGRLNLLANDGTGAFAAANSIVLSAEIVPMRLDGAFDANGDGTDDVVIRVGNNTAPGKPGKFYVALTNGVVALASIATIQSITVVERVVVGDVNGDGFEDACVVGTQTGVASTLIAAHLGTGNAALFGPTWVSTLGVTWPQLAAASLVDVDQDADLDLAFSSDQFGGVALARNVGGVFDLARGFDTDTRGSFVGVGHLDAGGHVDAIVVDRFNPNGPRIAVLRTGCAGGVGTYGAACAGSGGFAPKLALQGCPSANETLTLKIRDAYGGPVGVLLQGLAPAEVQVGGGCSLLVGQLLPAAFALPIAGVGPGNGTLDANIPLPPAIPAVTLHVQFVSPDPTVGSGFTLSNALAIVFP